jgi:outer membrane protein
MKRTALSLAALALVFQAAPVLAELKVGYIDSDVVKDRLPEFRESQRKLDQLLQEYERESTDRQTKLVKLQQDFQGQELLMSEVRRLELQSELDEKIRLLQDFNVQKFGPEGELVRKNIELSGPIFEQVNRALQAIGREDGYDFIFDVAGTGAIVFVAEGKFDLTERLLSRLEEEREDREKGK